MGLCPIGYTLERKNNNHGYCPKNCKWASMLDQGNNKRNNVLVYVGGSHKTVSQASRESGIGYNTMYYRARLSKYKNKNILRKPQ